MYLMMNPKNRQLCEPSAGVRHEGHMYPGHRLLYMVLWLITAIVTCSVVFPGSAFAELELSDGYFTLLDEADKEIFHTAIVLVPGDMFISEDNSAYEVVTIEGRVARARFVETVTLDDNHKTSENAMIQILSAFARGLSELFLARPQTGGTVVLYNTHSDESYEASSGASSKDWGDVYKVAAVFEQALKKHGFDVVRSTANHNPHDGGAYARSRRTLAQLLKEQPVAAFDIHRDAVPPEAYNATVSGEEVTKITLVIGQQNQTRGQNLNFAKQLKSATDSKSPGLIKGILWGQGNYNQDMLPRAALLEVGAHTNRLEEAEAAVGMFASSIASVLAAAAPESGLEPGSPGRSIAWIIGILVVTGVGYVLINSGKRQKQ